MSAVFFKAIQDGDKDRVESLLHDNPNLLLAKDKDNLSPLMVAVYNHKPEIASLFLERMAALSIHEAAATGKMTHIISNLAREPELVNTYAEDGFQPLGLAAYFGQQEAVEYLLKAGAQVNSPVKNALGVTPLQSAVAGCHLEITDLLLRAGADPNVKDSGGSSPIHVAAQCGDARIAHLLIFGGANLETASKDGKQPLDVALEAGHEEVAELIRKGITRRFRKKQGSE
jgi:ankyrin repeat protein